MVKTDAGVSGGAKLSGSPRTFADLGPDEVRGLDPESYVSPRTYAREVERIFHREWLCVGRVQDVKNPGDYVSFDLLGRHISARVVSTHSGRVALAFSRPLSERDLKLLYQT